MPDAEVFVTLGIDTHKHTHLAVALDQLGRRLDQLEIPTTTAGFAQLYSWACGLGTIDTVGIEGTGAYGAGLCRWLRERGLVVVEVERPDRKLRRNAGKSDEDPGEDHSHGVQLNLNVRSGRDSSVFSSVFLLAAATNEATEPAP